MASLTLAHTSPVARPVTVLFADQDVWYWQVAVDSATDEMLATAVGDTRGLLDAADRLKAARTQLKAARLKHRRVVCEAAGRRWLRLAVSGG